MVEVIYNEKNAEATRTENLIRLPKNIRQIGVCDNFMRIYMEDYVQSYIRRISVYHDDACFVLFGKAIFTSDKQYLLVSGAIRVEEKQLFSHRAEVYTEAWEKLRIAAKEYFPDLERVGFANVGSKRNLCDTEVIHRRFFSEKRDVYYWLTDGDEEFYILSNGRLKKENGYYIYFSPNEAMQNYMVESRENEETFVENEVSESSEGPEETMMHFRSIMRERKEEVQHHRTVTYLSFASTFLVILVIAIGITMINNYEKMREMETMLAGISTMLSTETMTAQEENLDDEVKTTVDLAKRAQHDAQANEVQEDNTQAVIATKQLDERNGTEVIVTEPAETGGTGVEAAEATETSLETRNSQHTYVVRKGDTLAKISWRFYQTADMVDEICKLNQIEDRDVIVYGKEILLP